MTQRAAAGGTDRSGAGGAAARTGPIAVVVGALGVVFGDIGTSPLYALPTALASAPNRSPEVVYGVASAFIWTIVLVVSVLYVHLLLRTTNGGEGGLLALFALLRGRVGRRVLVVVTALGMVGTATFLADGAITPAISVLSAVEGLQQSGSGWAAWTPLIAVVVLVALFALQRVGAQRIGRLFGPVMTVWFVVIAVLGAASIALTPGVLLALSPHWAVLFFVEHPLDAFRALGGIVLAVTGAEALYASVGDFGPTGIARAWWFVVLPALGLNYLGQAAHVLRDPAHAGTGLFFALAPGWAVLPLTVLATAAAIIASQAVVSGAFSVVHQAGRLGLLPPLRAQHPSEERATEVYLPLVNALLTVIVCGLVLGFRTSAALAAAYGVAVTVTMTVTCTLFLLLARSDPSIPRRREVLAAGLLVVVVALFAGNAAKVVSGGALPVLVAVVLVVVMRVWWVGSARLRAGAPSGTPAQHAVRAASGSGAPRSPVTAVLLVGSAGTAHAVDVLREIGGGLPRTLVLASLEQDDVPRVDADRRIAVTALGDGVWRVVCRAGFRQRLPLPELLAEPRVRAEIPFDDGPPALYVAPIDVPIATSRPGFARAWQSVFTLLTRLEADRVGANGLPRDRTIFVGGGIELSRPRAPRGGRPSGSADGARGTDPRGRGPADGAGR